MSRTPRILRQPNPNFRRSGRPEAGPQQRVVIDPGRSAIAGKYFLSDVPGATEVMVSTGGGNTSERLYGAWGAPVDATAVEKAVAQALR